jgi:hypothetical protein
MQSKTDMGFGKKIRADWLDSALYHAAAGRSFEEVRKALASEIAAHNSGAEAIRKIQTGLKRVWFTPPDYCSALRDYALRLYRKNDSPATRMLLHWGMCLSAYPFIGTVAETIGRLLKLQKEARLADIERRIREQHGDRGFVSRITRYDVSSFVDWGIIRESTKAGFYLPGTEFQVRNSEQLSWLAEAVLIWRDESQMPFAQLFHHPILFPFRLETFHASIISGNPRLKIERQSMNEEFVALRSAKPH